MPKVDLELSDLIQEQMRQEEEKSRLAAEEKNKKRNAIKRAYLIQKTTGRVFGDNPILRQRDDMMLFNGIDANQAEKLAPKVVKEYKERFDNPMGFNQDSDDEGVREGVATSRLQTIVGVIRQLSPGDENHFTNEGLPRVEAIEMILGDDLRPGERDAAWNIAQNS